MELKPVQAAELANDVYALSRQPTTQKALDYLNLKHGEVFKFSDNNLLKGKTGGPGFIKCRTGFGFLLLGDGPLKCDAFIIFRGTQYLADWLTNLNVTLSRSSYGQPAHDGFNQAFKSMQPKLRDFITQTRGRTVHCIGHSLGGAIATLCAEWLVSANGIKPHLYTFGSPRVGLQGFADMCTKNVGCGRIYRVYHKTDIVPCIPIWPFIHTPSSGKDYYIPSPGMIPTATYHDMGKYIDSVDEKNDWGLLGALKEGQKTDSGIEQWLKQSAPLSMTLSTLEWLNHAIAYVIRKCMAGAAHVISQGASSSFTIMDRLALIIEKGVNLAETVSRWVIYLLRKILSLLGYKPAVDAADVTRHFVRQLLVDLQHKVNQFARQALSNTLVQGRAI